MTDLGAPQSYLTFPPGTAVLDAAGERIGTVRHVLAAEQQDIFDGLVIDTASGPRFVDAPLIDGLYERGAVLTGEAPPAERLPEPSANPTPEAWAAGNDEQETAGRPAQQPDLGDKLRRAWDRLSGGS